VRYPEAQEPPAGLVYNPDFIEPELEARVIEFLGTLEYNKVEMRGAVAKRKVRHFGLRYSYDGGALEATDPLPEPLEPVRRAAASFLGIEPEEFEEILVSMYPPGAGIGWHRDAPMFGDVVGVSFGSECLMRFRRELPAGSFEAWGKVLEPRSAYILSGSARWKWQHSIPGAAALRYSTTFRTLRKSSSVKARETR
jgi:alkylated DNA repair dioxygenase AlkB